MSTVILWVGRAMLPFSFLVALLLRPCLMLSEWRSMPRIWAAMWDDPL
jgi:hypothetical protein